MGLGEGRVAPRQQQLEMARAMAANGVRRLPLVDRDGALVGLVTKDDLVLALGRRLGDVAEVVLRELANEARPAEVTSSVFGKE